MVIAVKDIVDGDSLKAWLDERPEDLRRQCAVWISSRIAVRLAPIAWDWFQFDENAVNFDLTSIKFCRSILVSTIAGLVPELDLWDDDNAGNQGTSVALHVAKADNAANSLQIAAYALGAASSFGDRSTRVSARAADVAISVLREFDAEVLAAATVHADCHAWLEMEETGEIDIIGLQSEPLWLYENPLVKEWEQLKARLLADATSDCSRGGDWSFWIDWYEGLLEGRVQNTAIIIEIVTTDEIDWKASPRVVNKAISKIVENFEHPKLRASRKQFDDLQSALRSAEQKHQDEIAALNN